MNFSVLLSIYGKEKSVYFLECLESLLSQTLLPDEIVLVKDGPLTEELECIIENVQDIFPFFKIVSLPTNKGLGIALNEGLKHCSYELVARMDTDDVAKSDRFEKQIAIFYAHPELDVVGAWIDEFEGTIGNVISIRKLPEKHEDICQFARKRCPVNHPVVMFRKSAVIAAGGYQHFSSFEDYYLWVRMLLNNARFYNIPESLLYFRFSPGMFRRRGGWKYAQDEFRFQRMLWKRGFVGFPCLIQNIWIRFIVRIIPNKIRIFLYKKILRDNSN